MRPIDADELTTVLDGYQHHIMLIKKKSRKIEEAILCDVKGIINSAPTIEERKKGKWIDLGAVFECSVCHERSCCAGNYCSDCGADMRDEEEEECDQLMQMRF